MKNLKYYMSILMIISFVWCIYNVFDGIKKKDWVVTYATIDWIGLPDGAVFGTYEDIEGIVHSEELYCSAFLQGYSVKTEKYIGKKVKIIYDFRTCKVLNYSKIICSRCISGVLLVISVLSLIILRKRRYIGSLRLF